MTRYRRRAYSLIYILAALPLITAIASSAYLLADRVLKVQGREQRRVTIDTISRDVVRRIQADASQARSAQIGSNAVSSELTLEQSGQQVVYRGIEGKITRTCTTAGAAPIVFDWKLPKSQVEFRIEAIKGSPGIAWITFVQEIRPETGPTRTWRLSAAAPIGQGGTP